MDIKGISIDLNNFLKTVDLRFLDIIYSYVPNSMIRSLSVITYDMYMRYLEKMKLLKGVDFYDNFFELLKVKNFMDNHNLLSDNLLPLMLGGMNNSEVNRILDIISERELTSEDMIRLNKNLLDVNFDASILPKFRQDDNFIVSIKREDGKRIFHYIPINHEDIPMASRTFLGYFNDASAEGRENLFIKPAIIHGLVVGLQMFEDGNSRLSSLLEHAKLYTMSKSLFDEDLPWPALYMDKSNFSYRTGYRDIIRDLVLYNDTEAWNEWLLFDLRMVQRQIGKNEAIVKKYLRR